MENKRNLGAADKKDFSQTRGKNKMNDNWIYSVDNNYDNRNRDKDNEDSKNILGADNKDHSRVHGKTNKDNHNRTYYKMNKDKEGTFFTSLETVRGIKEDNNKSNGQPLVNNSNHDKDNKDNTRAQDKNNNSDNQVNQRTSSKSLFSKERATKTNSFQTRKIGSIFVGIPHEKKNKSFIHTDLKMKENYFVNNKPESDNPSVTVSNDGPKVKSLGTVIGKNRPKINDTNKTNDKPNIDETNILKNEPPLTVEISVLISIILILALFILPFCIYKAKSLHVLRIKNKLAPKQTTISQTSTAVPSGQPREDWREVCVL